MMVGQINTMRYQLPPDRSRLLTTELCAVSRPLGQPVRVLDVIVLSLLYLIIIRSTCSFSIAEVIHPWSLAVIRCDSYTDGFGVRWFLSVEIREQRLFQYKNVLGLGTELKVRLAGCIVLDQTQAPGSHTMHLPWRPSSFRALVIAVVVSDTSICLGTNLEANCSSIQPPWGVLLLIRLPDTPVPGTKENLRIPDIELTECRLG
ncbi:hypothetical protein NEUTE2DRAFT_127174 [Neurospora tetrasperma FGSC 2509]|nr:hypothetical protein NEUTE2DRAFT_127174 [Neurospora tetrasperma FGSC 2509]